MKRHLVASTVFLFLLVVARHPALGQVTDATNSMSWLDGFSLVVLESQDVAGLHRARVEIQSHGGRVAILSPPSFILGWVPREIQAELIGKAGIKSIHDTEIPPSEIETRDPQSRAMLNYYNSVARGDYQAKELQRMGAAPPARWPGGGSDALERPPLDDASYIENLRAAGLDVAKLRDQGLLLRSSALLGNSDAMTGTISVTLFLVESDGTIDPNLYTWTDQHVQDYVDGVNTGLAWWTLQAYSYFDCWNAFLVRYFPPTDSRCNQGYEPVTRSSAFTQTWVNIVIGQFGYTSGNVFSRVTAYNTFQRTTYGTDWAYSAFVAYNPPGSADRFTDGTSAFAYLGGPYTVLLYRSYSWAPNQVFTHETGHIFYACDEYDGSGCSCGNSCVGKPNDNCYVCSANFCMMKANDFTLCAWTPGQIGWLGSGCAPPPLPAPAPSGVNPPGSLQGVPSTVTVSGSNFVYGADVDMGPNVTVHSTTFVNSGTLSVDLTVNNNAPLGLVDVTVTNRDLQSVTVPDAFEVLRTTHHYASLSGSAVFPYVTPATGATSFADVLVAAGDGDSILVQSGTYAEGDSVVISTGFILLGAWNGAFTARDLVNGKSVIDLNTADSHSMIVQSGGNPMTIDGFVILNGVGSLRPSPIAGDYGGAIYIKNSTVTISNCEIGPNTAGTGGSYGAGGAVYASGSTVSFHDNVFSQNSAGQGGAIYLDGCTGSIADNTISSNAVVVNTEIAGGGAMYLTNCSGLTLTNNTISMNSADVGVPGEYHGGGIRIFGSTGIEVSGGGILYNDAGGSGGGIYCEASELTLTGVLIRKNTANIGAGVSTAFDTLATLTATDCEFLWNTATILGGGIYASGIAFINHSLFVGNRGNTNGGGCYLTQLADGSFIGNTLDRNRSNSPNTGGVILVDAGIPVFNNIVTNSRHIGINCLGGVMPTESHNNVWGSFIANYGGCTPGTGSISADPLYADTAAGDYHLLMHSPSIDAGAPGGAYSDPDGSRGDMGRYGSHAMVMDQPAYPTNLRAELSFGDVVLRWAPNGEADVVSYAVYCDTISGFVPSALNFVQLVAASDSVFNAGAPADTSYYRIAAIDTSGYASGYSNVAAWGLATGVGETASYRFGLYQNHPNPFNPTTRIRFEIGERLPVTLSIFDVHGRLVRRLVDDVRGPGVHSVEWNGKSDQGASVSSGIYFYRLEAGDGIETRKMVLLK
jgi:predicted outer membrane repeat protein